jgi:hypothetical protein
VEECIDHLLDKLGLPLGLERVIYNARMITWCLRISYFARRGDAWYAEGETHSFEGFSMVQIVEYFYSVADNLHNELVRDWLASRGVNAGRESMERSLYVKSATPANHLRVDCLEETSQKGLTTF